MALSDHDQTVLSEMEEALRPDTTRFAPRPSVKRESRHYLAAAIALMIVGAVTIAVGLRLADQLGTCLGVLGFLLIVGSGWNATHLVSPLRGWMDIADGKTARNPR
jgi:hypothetical protein